MCLYPKLVKNPKYLPNKKNKGVVPTLKDERVGMVPVGCGKCMECRKKRGREWRIRLLEEHKSDRRGKFITFSFSDKSLIRLEEDLRQKGFSLDGYDLDNEICRLAVERFALRWKNEFGHRPKRWFITEIGAKNTERVHLHGILYTIENKETIERLWRYGNVWIGQYCDSSTMSYITKYMTKTDPVHKEYVPRVFTSPGIGKGYTEGVWKKFHKYKEEGGTLDFYRYENGNKDGLPIYYRNKLWNDEEREKLWIEKIEKEVRYINGIEIDVSEDDRRYWSVLQVQRQRNKELGYGDDSINWERRIYERNLRKLKKKQRDQKSFKMIRKR